MKFVIIITSILFFCCRETDSNNNLYKSQFEGTLLPDFNVQLLNNSTFNTKSIPIGQPLVLFYFTPNCPYCNAQMTDLINNYKELQKVTILALTPNLNNETDQFYSKFKINNYPNFIMAIDSSRFFKRYYNTRGVPYLAFYNTDKKLTQLVRGKITFNQMKHLLKQ